MHSFREKAVSIDSKTPKIKFCHKKSTLKGEKVKIIEIIFLFWMPAA